MPPAIPKCPTSRETQTSLHRVPSKLLLLHQHCLATLKTRILTKVYFLHSAYATKQSLCPKWRLRPHRSIRISPCLVPTRLFQWVYCYHQYWILPTKISSKPCQTCTSLGFPENKCISIPNCNAQATSTTLFSSTSAASSLVRGDGGFGNSSSTINTSDKTSKLVHSITVAPLQTSTVKFMSNSSMTQGDECLLQDAYCSLRGPGHSLDGLKDECLLWDSACSGDKSFATSHFYGSIASILMNNTCFLDPSPECSKSNPPGRISAFDEVKDWMRSPQCLSENPNIIAMEDGNDANVIKEDMFLNETCCDNCEVAADRVDVYYWPNPNANTSCLSIIGDGNSDLAVGATTDKAGNVYWGCTSWEPITGKPGPGSPLLVTTATLTSVASMTFRSYLYNPWGDSPCENSSTFLSSNSNLNVKPRGEPPPLHPRGHTLILPNSSVSTAILGNFTLWVSHCTIYIRMWMSSQWVLVPLRPYISTFRA